MEASVVLAEGDVSGLPSERLEAQDVKALVPEAIDRAISEAHAAAAAFIEALAPAPISDPAAPSLVCASAEARAGLGRWYTLRSTTVICDQYHMSRPGQVFYFLLNRLTTVSRALKNTSTL